jgi:antirestriction protein ArdC
LIAELGAAFQCIKLGVSSEPRADHAKYLNGWLAALKNDKKLIVKAARLAQQAVDHIEGYQSSNEQEAA